MTVEATTFTQLNDGWNADPNAPSPQIEFDGNDLLLRFRLNYFQFPAFHKSDVGVIRFHACSRYRLTNVNDEGWYRGQCRFSDLAPAWGEFYEVAGDFMPSLPDIPWRHHAEQSKQARNYLFYLRDNAFECTAEAWSFDQSVANALRNLSTSEPATKRNAIRRAQRKRFGVRVWFPATRSMPTVWHRDQWYSTARDRDNAFANKKKRSFFLGVERIDK